MPRINNGYPHGLKVAQIPGYDGQTIHQRCSSNQSIAIGTGIRNMQSGATLGYGSIDREYATGERWQDVPVYPRAENAALLRIASFDEQDSYL